MKEKSKFRKILPYGKIRASYAEVGSDTDPYQLLPVFYTDTTGAYSPYAHISDVIPPANLKPEQLVSKELGTDLRFLKNRIGIDFTYYRTNSFNQIIQLPVSSASGSRWALINAGNIQNSGLELQANVKAIDKKKVQWTFTWNYTKYRNS